MQNKKGLVDKIMQYENKEYLAYLLILAANFFWCVTWIYPNEHNFSSSLTTLIRGLSSGFVSMGICLYNGFAIDFKSKEDFKWLFIRSFIMAIHNHIMALAQFYLPLPLVHIIHSSGTLYICIWNYFIFGAKITYQQLKGIIVGFIGVILVINGRIFIRWIDPSYAPQTNYQNYKSKDPKITALVALILFVIVVFWAYSIVIMKKIKNSNTIQINTYVGILFIMASGITFPNDQGDNSLTQYAYGFVFFGIPLALSQYLFTAGILLAKNTGAASMIIFTSVIWAYLLSIFRYDQSQNVICSTGVILVVLGVWRILFSKEE